SAKVHGRISDNVMNCAYGSASVAVSAADSSELRMDYSGNDLSQTGGDGMTVRTQGTAYLNLSVRNSRFNAIGGQALILADSSDATGSLRANVHDNLFQTVGGNGVRVESTGAADFYLRIADNSMSSVNSSTASAAILVDGTSGAAGSNVDLIVTGNVIVPGAGNAIELRQAAPGTMRLEGAAANAAQQLADTNPATPIATSGTITMVATGTVDPQIPLELSGLSWLDNDKNGVRATGDNAELPAQDVMFTLTGTETGAGRSVSLQSRSDDQGVYLFAGLLPGTFTVTVIPPLGMVVSPSNQGTDDTLDSDFSTTTRTASVTLAALTSESTNDAGVRQTWQNSTNRRDVDNDTFVVPRDVLIIINTLNSEGARELPTPTPGGAGPPPYYDVNGDGFVAPNDALVIINFLNGATSGEGEAAAPTVGTSETGAGDAGTSETTAALADAVFAAESWNSRRRSAGRAGG
ncbi:MAG TPA: SdrD B-like domain-containing protein, partial [Pirellulaceae bacterium]|nr:SdrD B-like domain-containing protein [Pirellulaceae bacterium]